MEKDTYSLEVREAIRGGNDYTENHYDFNTPEEVKDFIKEHLSEDERVHSVSFYPAGTSSNPRDVTSKFMQSKPTRLRRI